MMTGKNWQCGACVEYSYSVEYCLLYKRKMKCWELCPDWKPIWEDV